MRTNEKIRAPNLRVIDAEGNQVGVITRQEALDMARASGLDLVEVVSTSNPPVCKIIDYGKFRYDQTKREKENKKAQHQIKVKEVKLKPNISQNDFDVKLRRARDFLEKGNKVKITCMFRGREMAHTDVGRKVVRNFVESLEDIGTLETNMKLLGRNLIVIMAPGKRKSAPSSSSSASGSSSGAPKEVSKAPKALTNGASNGAAGTGEKK
ncbi:Translation initiation factor IF-3 [Chlamydiales bacterium SCGC AG-110-M15]|nr:Translation initiation factor IF-3 [Chlamydiales bacterium SCGC AG-110-M15]